MKRISLLIAALMLGSTFPQLSFGFSNPLKNYDLYADTHRGEAPAATEVNNDVSDTKQEKQETKNAKSNNRPP